jgi:type II secretory pathway component PulC
MEGEFESFIKVVSNGCETNMKKFNFNFKFLDRFKKSRANETESEVNPEDFIDETNDTNEVFENFKEMPRQSASETEDFTSRHIVHEPTHTDINFSDDNPEVFAEKTLSNFNIDQFQADQSTSDNTNDEENEGSSDLNEMHSPTFASADVELPEKPEAASRFKIRFPKFGRSSTPKAPKASDPLEKKFTDRFKGSPIKSLDKFNWNDFVLKFFSPYSRGKIHGVFVILLVVTFTYMIGKSIALFMGRSTPIVTSAKSTISVPPPKMDTTSQDINRITSTNLFNIKESDKASINVEKKDIASIICIDAEKPTAEPLKLLDTIVLQDSVKSVASVQVRGSGDLVNVREGEQLNNAVEVTKINRMKLILKNLSTGDCEYIASDNEDLPLPNLTIYSPQKGKKLLQSTNPMIKNVGNNFKIKKQLRDKLIGNMSEVLTQAKAIQITNPDGSLSFKMTEIVPGSIYSNLNIENNDIITSINGKKIENLNELMSLLGRIKDIDQFQIGVQKNGKNENLDFNFE